MIELVSYYVMFIGLIAQFKGERTDNGLHDFKTWLEEKHFDHMLEQIEANHEIGLSVQRLLHENLDSFNDKLQCIEQLLIKISAPVSGFGDLAKAINPLELLSSEVYDLLKQMDDSGDSVFIYSMTMDGLASLDGESGSLTFNERFIKSDLESLVSINFLIRLRQSSVYDASFGYTRLAHEYVKLNEERIVK